MIFVEWNTEREPARFSRSETMITGKGEKKMKHQIKSIRSGLVSVCVVASIMACADVVNVNGVVTVNDPVKQDEVRLKAEETRLKAREFALKEEQLKVQKERDKVMYVVDVRAEDDRLQEEARLKNDGKCIDYFNGIRCSKRSSHDGLCAKHYREKDKGIKDKKYQALGNQKLRIRGSEKVRPRTDGK